MPGLDRLSLDSLVRAMRDCGLIEPGLFIVVPPRAECCAILVERLRVDPERTAEVLRKYGALR